MYDTETALFLYISHIIIILSLIYGFNVMHDKQDDVSPSPYDAQAHAYSQGLRSGNNYFHRFLEKPNMYARLPDLSGKSVLCLACGSGEECAYIQALGAKRIVGLDSSKGLIDIARASYKDIEFVVRDMRKIDFVESEFDFVYSSLGMHYVPYWTDTLRAIRHALKRGGRFLFSTHHPVYWGRENLVQADGTYMNLLGISRNDQEFCIYGDYLTHRAKTVELYSDLFVTFFHKPLSEIFSEIQASGFVIREFCEPKPEKALQEFDADLFQLFERIPIFMIFDLLRADCG